MSVNQEGPMNRADRRRQDKQAGNRSVASRHSRVRLQEVMAWHQAGQLERAEQGYQEILQLDASCADAWHLSGLVAYHSGALEMAADRINQAIRLAPTHPAYSYNLGLVLQKRGQIDDAVQAYAQALRLRPHYPEALGNLAHLHLEQGRFREAEQMYRSLLALQPASADAQNGLGVALKEQACWNEAEAAYRQALTINPRHPEGHCNLGALCLELGRYAEAVAALETALQLKPSYVNARYHLGFAWLWAGNRERAHECFRQTATLKQDHRQPTGAVTVFASRLKHDAEQIEYLLSLGLIPDGARSYLAALQTLRRSWTTSSPAGGNPRIVLTADEAAAVAPSFNQILNWGQGDAMAEGALNPSLDVPAIEADYAAHGPGITYVDGLLREEALDRLRRWCWEATVWKRDYENGYLGAFLGDGFTSPLLLQVAEELRVRLPAIFQGHKLTQAWAFKQDSERKGLNMHADAAAVNVNFWMTPDEANLDPDRGGLVVWDKEAPREWNFKDYNSSRNEPKVREFLRAAGARAVTVPYRANRAVIFNSDLFHETDRLNFRDDYESRRINITLLYGRRGR
jgi:tetratricopeptide (TPR) repeat protein